PSRAGGGAGGGGPPRPRRRSACAGVRADATTADALAAVAEPLRYDTNALLCAIAGYPRTGCGEQVSADGERSGTGNGADGGTDDGAADSGPSLGLPVGAGVVALLAGAAVWQARRRRDESR
ncbi:GPS-CTERM domain-containing protein, partial [Streptomyces tricolor]